MKISNLFENIQRLAFFGLVVFAVQSAYGTEWKESTQACEGTVTFPDENLERAVRTDIDQPDGEIDAEDLLDLDFFHGEGFGIVDLTNIRCIENMTVADLIDNEIVDFTPLTELEHLEDVVLSGNNIVDLSPLRSMALERIELERNQISDLSPVAEMPQIGYLDLAHNQISDLSPLAAISGFGTLDLEYNQITDLEPLAENDQLTDGSLNIAENPLDCEDPDTLAHIQSIEDRGVYVSHDCGGGGDADADSDTDSDADSDTDADADGDGDGDGDSDGDSDGDGDADGDDDPDENENDDGDANTGECGCHLLGSTPRAPFFLLQILN